MRLILASNWFVRSFSRFWLSAKFSKSARCAGVNSSGVLPSGSFFSNSSAWACNLRCSCKIRPASPLTSRELLHGSMRVRRSDKVFSTSSCISWASVHGLARRGGRRFRVGVVALAPASFRRAVAF